MNDFTTKRKIWPIAIGFIGLSMALVVAFDQNILWQEITYSILFIINIVFLLVYMNKPAISINSNTLTIYYLLYNKEYDLFDYTGFDVSKNKLGGTYLYAYKKDEENPKKKRLFNNEYIDSLETILKEINTTIGIEKSEENVWDA